MKTKKVIVFDLDDTLYNEIDFLKSAYKEIASIISDELLLDYTTIYEQMLEFYHAKKNVFSEILSQYKLIYSCQDLLNLYRNHKPNIKLTSDRKDVISWLKCNDISMGILTDGRSLTQRNKIEALGLNKYISEIVISEEFGSEKPNINNYKHFETIFGQAQYFYIGDNIKKDFVTPNACDWITIRVLDNGLNIHKTNTISLNKNCLAQKTIKDFNELKSLINI